MVAAVSFQMLVTEREYDVLIEALNCYSEMVGDEFPSNGRLADRLEVRLSQLNLFPESASG